MASLPIGPVGFVSPFDTTVAGKAKAQTTTGGTSGSGATTGTATDPFSTGNLGSTFLNLLVQELKNQDPTQPMDPTQTVGQLISLNQLDQLISINQTLKPATTAASGTTSGSTTSGTAGSGSTTSGSTTGTKPSLVQAADAPAQVQASQQAAVAALQAAQAANGNPSAPLNLNALTNLIGAR